MSRVRTMAEGELERVIAVWHETSADTYDFIEIERGRPFHERDAFFRARIAPACEILVFDEDGEIPGFLALRGSYVDRLYVHPGHQRRGIGESLLAEARRRSPHGLELHTHVKNAKARAFYEKHGFVAVRFGVSPPPESEPDVEYHWRP